MGSWTRWCVPPERRIVPNGLTSALTHPDTQERTGSSSPSLGVRRLPDVGCAGTKGGWPELQALAVLPRPAPPSSPRRRPLPFSLLPDGPGVCVWQLAGRVLHATRKPWNKCFSVLFPKWKVMGEGVCLLDLSGLALGTTVCWALPQALVAEALCVGTGPLRPWFPRSHFTDVEAASRCP